MIFFAAFGLQGDDAALNLLDKVEGACSNIVSSLKSQTNPLPDWQRKILPEVNGAVTYLSLERNCKSWFSHASSDNVDTFAYGEIYQAEKDPAQEILNQWSEGGLSRALSLDGLYSTIIIEKSARRVHVGSDYIGTRGFFYAEVNGCLLVSNIDLAIFASGMISSELDEENIACLCSFGWPLRSGSLLRDVNATTATQPITWENKSVAVHDLRINSGELDQIQLELGEKGGEDWVNYSQKQMKAAIADEASIAADITAGVDSRITLGIALSLTNPENIYSQTQRFSPHANPDTIWGAHLAKCTGISHTFASPEGSYEDFSQRSREYAFWGNGNCDSVICMINNNNLHSMSHDFKVWGAGGEIYMGYWYPTNDRKEFAKQTDETVIQSLFGRFDFYKRSQWMNNPIPWKDESWNDKIKSLLHSRLTEIAEHSKKPVETSDLLYIWERAASWWGARTGCRNAIMQTYYTPFMNPGFVRYFISNTTIEERASKIFYKVMLKKFMQKFYEWPLTGGFPIRLFGLNSRLLRLGRRIWNRLPWTNIFAPKNPDTSVDETILNSPMVKLPLKEIRAVIMHPKGVAQRMFDAKALDAIFNEFDDTVDVSQFYPSLRMLYVVEHWRKIKDEIQKSL